MIDRSKLELKRRGWRRGQEGEEKETLRSWALAALIMGLAGAVVATVLPFLFMGLARSRGARGEFPPLAECFNLGFTLGCAAFGIVLCLVARAVGGKRGRW